MSDGPAPTSHRRPRGRRWVLVVVALVVVAGVGYGAVRLVDSSGSDSTSGAKASPTPLASMDLSRLPVARSSPCDRVAEDDVATALGGQVEVSERYAPGDRVALARGLRDVTQEFGCSYRDTGGAEARLWVFAHPVDRASAARIVREATAEKGCRVVRDGPGFGSPAVATSCPGPQPGRRSVTMRGLFGDAWLTCQLTVPANAGSDPVRRTERWCVGVVARLGAES